VTADPAGVWRVCLDCCESFLAPKPARGGMLPQRCPACRHQHQLAAQAQWKRDLKFDRRENQEGRRSEEAHSVAAALQYGAGCQRTIVDAEHLIEHWKREG